MKKRLVLDSYALIAYLEDEKGAGKVQEVLADGEKGKLTLFMSIVNWAEVYYSMYRAKGEKIAQECLLVIDQLPIKLVDINRGSAFQAAKIKSLHSLALGDCFAAALAGENGCPVLTGDKGFKKLEQKMEPHGQARGTNSTPMRGEHPAPPPQADGAWIKVSWLA